MGADFPSSDVGPLALALQRRHSFTGDRSSSRANIKVAQNPFAPSRQASNRPFGAVNFMPEQVNSGRPIGQTPSVTGIAYIATTPTAPPPLKTKHSAIPRNSSRSATPPAKASSVSDAPATRIMAGPPSRPQSSGSLPTNITPPAPSAIARSASPANIMSAFAVPSTTPKGQSAIMSQAATPATASASKTTFLTPFSSITPPSSGSHVKPPAAPSAMLTRQNSTLSQTNSLSRLSTPGLAAPVEMGPLTRAVSARQRAAMPPPQVPIFTASLDSETWRSICEEGRAEADRKRGFYLPPDNRSELKQWLAHDIMLRHVPNHPMHGTRTVPVNAIPVMPPARPAPPPPPSAAAVVGPVAPSFRQWAQGQTAEMHISQQQLQHLLPQQGLQVSQPGGLRSVASAGQPSRPSATSAGSGSSEKSLLGTAVASSGASVCSSPRREVRPK